MKFCITNSDSCFCRSSYKILVFFLVEDIAVRDEGYRPSQEGRPKYFLLHSHIHTRTHAHARTHTRTHTPSVIEI